MKNRSIMEDTLNKNPQKTIIASFVINEELHRQIKIYAASTGKKIKDVVNEAITAYLERRTQE